MYGATGKMGRGGGAGSKRNVHAPPINRAAPTGRLSVGGGPRGRGAVISSPSTSSRQVEESFSLVRENPLNFGMAIKLAPDLVEEIKRVEAQSGTARIKFDANANNPNGNVIHVGDKSFKFTWSREPGDLCDIYEERQSGEDGNGLLVESGGTWRKLNVERELDESTKNHVKRRSEEAERKLKSRKAIVLDHQHPAMKNQMKAFAASETNQRRHFMNRKEPPSKKPKSEPPSGVPSKSVYKSSLPTTSVSRGRLSAGSPLSSQPEQHGAPISPVGSSALVKGHAAVPDVAATQNMNKVSISDKEITNRKPNSTISEKSKYTQNTEANPADLRNLMISLLQEHQSTGMSLKALEKAIGDAMPNSSRKIDPILKQIAIFQTPGIYILKPKVEMESFKKLSQSGSSPEINCDMSPAPQKFDQLPSQDHNVPMTAAADDEEPGELNSTPVQTKDMIEEIDILLNSPENLGNKIVSNNSQGIAGSSSDSGSDSDSDSDSSDSGSDSGSPTKSKSRSPVGSQSGSSSDSETEASSSSKQASDEDIDIIASDDDKELMRALHESEPISSRDPVQLSNIDDDSVDIGDYEVQDHHASDVIEIEKDSPEDNHEAERPAANYSSANNEGEERVEEMIPSSVDLNEQQDTQVLKAYDNEPDGVVNDGFKHGQSGIHEKVSKGKSKRRSDDKHSDGRAHNKKRSKIKSSSHHVSGAISSIFGESPYNSSPDKPLEGPDKGPVDLMEDRTSKDYTNDPDVQTGPDISTRPVSDSQQPVQRSTEAHAWTGEKRPGKHKGVERGFKPSERSFQAVEGLQVQKGFNVETQSESGLVNEKRPLRSSTDGVGDKHGPVIESHNRKPEIKEAAPYSNSYRGHPPKDNNTSTAGRSPLMNGRSGVLRREHSDLELGEFREPSHEETPGSMKQREKKSSFKHLENKPMDSEYWNSDFSRGKKSHKITADSEKPNPPNSEAVVSSIPDGPYKRKAQENNVDDLTRPHNRSTRPLDAHHQSWGDHVDVGSQQNAVPEMSGKSRFAEVCPRGPSLEAYGDTSRRMPVNSTEQQHDPTQGVGDGVGVRAAKEIKKQKPKMVGVSNDRRLDAVAGSNDAGQKKKVSASDENISAYTKYEKEEPELKGPIKDISQYKEYVREYQEKYESYCSLSKILESYRDEFNKLGKDLEAYKDRDMKRYHDILEQMRSSFRQCGERHKRLKKIFIVIYEELKHVKRMIKDFAASYKKD